MAKQSALQLVNKVLANLGESSNLTVLTSLTGISLLVFNTLNEVLYDLSQEENGHWKPLEDTGTATLTSAVTTYAKPSSAADFDRNSFRYNGTSSLTYYTPQRFDFERLNSTESGIPDKLIDYGGHFRPHPVPNSAASTKLITWRQWILPTPLSTATPAGTCWIPEGFDLTLLADLVTYKILHYKHNEQAAVYFTKVYGSPDGRQRGSLDKFKAMWRSPDLLDGDNIMVASI